MIFNEQEKPGMICSGFFYGVILISIKSFNSGIDDRKQGLFQFRRNL